MHFDVVDMIYILSLFLIHFIGVGAYKMVLKTTISGYLRSV